MSSRITPLFSPNGGVEQHILALIATAQKTISMAAYEFTNLNIAGALVAALRRGVQVTLVLDRGQTTGQQATIHDRLLAAGAEVRLTSPPGGIMHDKYIIVDATHLEWGSYNYTQRAENNNYENATFTSDPSLAQQYQTNFATIFNAAKAEPVGVQRLFRRLGRRIVSPLKHEK